MRDPHLPPAGRHRARHNKVRREQIESDRRPHDIDDRIDRPDFVKADGLDALPVHSRLGFGDSAEDAAGKLLLCGSESGRRVDDRQDVAQVPVRVLLGVPHADVRSAESLLQNRLHFNRNARQTERVDRLADGVERDSGVDQRRECHVAADAGRAIEVGDAHCGTCRRKGFSGNLPLSARILPAPVQATKVNVSAVSRS